MMQALFSNQFFVFLISGGIAAAANFFSRILFSHWLGYSAAIVLAYLVGMVTAFFLFRLFVFERGKQAVHRSVMIFTLVNLLAVAQTWGISLLLAYQVLPFLGVSHFVKEIAHAVGVLVPVFTSYVGHKRWSFR
jgi:putative flippase GtrA